jgi:hypothetical protein
MKERPPNYIAQNGYRDALDCRDFVKCMALGRHGRHLVDQRRALNLHRLPERSVGGSNGKR